MQLTRGLALLALLAACEHKNARDDQPKAEPVEHPTQPSPDPSPAARAKEDKAGMAVNATGSGSASGSGSGGSAATVAPADEVRKPTKEDLELYTKDIPGKGKLTAVFETPKGKIHCELFGDKAPMTVANF